MIIGQRKIGITEPPFIIAEMSGNHNQSFERAEDIIKAAAKSGAHAVKFQTYTAETMTLDIREREFFINDPESLWYGQSLFDLFQKAYTPWEWHQPLFDLCRKLDMIPFSSAFDASAVDFLENLNVPCHKIASPENTDFPLIQKAAETGKPLLVSIGMATEEEIAEILTIARQAGCSQIALLKCTSAYPANPEDANIKTIPYLRERFAVDTGLSDHTPGIGTAIAAVACGACIIEKHFTLSRKDGGVDAAFSMEPYEMKLLVEESLCAWNSLGTIHFGPTSSESISLKGRRSLYVVEKMKSGEIFTERNVRSIRPGYGLAPKHLKTILGKRTTCNIDRGTALNWDMVKNHNVLNANQIREDHNE